MKITDSVYIVASGKWGFGMTHELDCNVYLVDGGDGCILIDSVVGLILPGTAAVFGIFLMRQYIQTLPTELEDAARIDGLAPSRSPTPCKSTVARP